MSEFVDDEGIRIRRERLFVAFQGFVLRHTVADELSAQAEGDLVTSAFAEFGLELDNAVRRFADKRCDARCLERLDRQLLRPQLYRQGVVDAIGGDCHLEWS